MSQKWGFEKVNILGLCSYKALKVLSSRKKTIFQLEASISIHVSYKSLRRYLTTFCHCLRRFLTTFLNDVSDAHIKCLRRHQILPIKKTSCKKRWQNVWETFRRSPSNIYRTHIIGFWVLQPNWLYFTLSKTL